MWATATSSTLKPSAATIPGMPDMYRWPTTAPETCSSRLVRQDGTVSQLAPHRAVHGRITVRSTLGALDVAVLDRSPETGVSAGQGSATGRGTALLVPGYTGTKEDFAAILDGLAERGYRV